MLGPAKMAHEAVGAISRGQHRPADQPGRHGRGSRSLEDAFCRSVSGGDGIQATRISAVQADRASQGDHDRHQHAACGSGVLGRVQCAGAFFDRVQTLHRKSASAMEAGVSARNLERPSGRPIVQRSSSMRICNRCCTFERPNRRSKAQSKRYGGTSVPFLARP